MDTTVSASAVLNVVPKKITKSHTCEEGGAHIKIFFFALISELEKQIII